MHGLPQTSWGVHIARDVLTPTNLVSNLPAHVPCSVCFCVSVSPSISSVVDVTVVLPIMPKAAIKNGSRPRQRRSAMATKLLLLASVVAAAQCLPLDIEVPNGDGLLVGSVTAATQRRGRTIQSHVLTTQVERGVRQWLGGPFAASPAGNNRWRPPQKVKVAESSLSGLFAAVAH